MPINNMLNGNSRILGDRNSNRKKSYNYLASGLKQYFNIGTNIFSILCSEMEDKPENIVIIGFLRSILQTMDSIIKLVEIGSIEPSLTLLRSLFENFVSLQYILEEKTEERARAYKAVTYNDRLKKNKRMLEQSQDFKETIENSIHKLDLSLKALEQRGLTAKGLAQAENSFGQGGFSEVKADIDRHKNKKIKWYDLYEEKSANNFKGLCKRMGYGNYYEIVHGDLSEYTHAKKAHSGIRAFSENDLTVRIAPLRYQKSVYSHSIFTFYVPLTIWLKMLDKYPKAFSHNQREQVHQFFRENTPNKIIAKSLTICGDEMTKDEASQLSEIIKNYPQYAL